MLALGQRGKVSDQLFLDIAEPDQPRMRYLLCIMRLASCFKYVEALAQLPDFSLDAGEEAISLEFPEDWLEEHPLTARELESEQQAMAKIGIDLSYR